MSKINQDIVIVGTAGDKQIVDSVKRIKRQERYQLVYDTAQKYEGGTTHVAMIVAKELGMKVGTVYNILYRIRTHEIRVEK